jgi:hypothetical protein
MILSEKSATFRFADLRFEIVAGTGDGPMPQGRQVRERRGANAATAFIV